MTTCYRKLRERWPHYLRRILRKLAGEFNRFVADPRQAKGRRGEVPTLRRALVGGVWTNRER